jgi:hypothetical protein
VNFVSVRVPNSWYTVFVGVCYGRVVGRCRVRGTNNCVRKVSFVSVSCRVPATRILQLSHCLTTCQVVFALKRTSKPRSSLVCEAFSELVPEETSVKSSNGHESGR